MAQVQTLCFKMLVPNQGVKYLEHCSTRVAAAMLVIANPRVDYGHEEAKPSENGVIDRL